ncbi:MAG: hypothetical protein AB7I19_06915 [Planctomycetota bacterium]
MIAKFSFVGIAVTWLGGCSTAPREPFHRDSMDIVEAAHRATMATTDLRARITELESLLSKEREIRSAVEAREREWIEERRRLVAKILETSLERVRLERELLAAKIASIESDPSSTGSGQRTASDPTSELASPGASRSATNSELSSGQALDRIRLPRH